MPVQAERSGFIGRVWTGADGWRIDDLKGEVDSAHISLCLSLTAALCPASIRTRLGRLLSPVHVGVPRPGVLLSTERSRREDALARFSLDPSKFSSHPNAASARCPPCTRFNVRYAASDSIPYSGSYTSAVTHGRCSKTANLRATATTARRLPFFPPRAASCSPHRRNPLSGASGPKM